MFGLSAKQGNNIEAQGFTPTLTQSWNSLGWGLSRPQWGFIEIEGINAIYVVVDCLSKYAHFISLKHLFIA